MNALSPYKLDAVHEAHAAVLDRLALLAQAVRAPRTSRDAAIPKFRTLLRALISDLEDDLEDHFRFEELHLFPALQTGGHGDVAESLILDHAALRKATRALLSHVQHALVESLTDEGWGAIGTITMSLIEKHCAHMEREEQKMVPALKGMLANQAPANVR